MTMFIQNSSSSRSCQSQGNLIEKIFAVVLLSAILCVVCCSLPQSLIAKPRVVDSLLVRLPQALERNDTTLVKLFNDISYEYWQFYPDSAAWYAQKALEKALVLRYSHGIAVAWENLGRVSITKGLYDSALVQYQRAMAVYERIGEKIGVVNMLNSIGLVHRSQAKYAESVEYYLRALRYLQSDSTLRSFQTANEQRNVKKTQAKLRNNIAMVFRLQGRYYEALEHLVEALRIAERLQDTSSIGGYRKNIGLIYEAQERYDEALRWYQEAFVIYEKLQDKQGIAACLSNIGSMYCKGLQADSAIITSTRAMNLFREIGNKPALAYCFYTLGNAYALKKQFSRAAGYYREAQTLNETLGNKEGIALSFIGLAQTSSASGLHTEAAMLFEQAAALAESIGARADAKEAYRGLAQEYEVLNNADKALAAHKRFFELHDSLFAEKSSRLLAELQVQRNSERQEIRIALLEREQQVQELALERQRTLKNFIAVLGIVASLAAGFAWYGYRTKRRNAEILERQNREILRQQHLLEEQSLEIHAANTDLQERNRDLSRAQEILEEQARDIEIANAELHERNLALQTANQEKNELMGIVAHDLKNPLSTVLFAVSSLERYSAKLTGEELRQQLQRIRQTANTMNEIILQLLETSALESGTMIPVMESVDITPILRGVIAEYQEKAMAKGIAILCDGSQTSQIAYCDGRMIRAVFDNLLSNAVKYSAHGKNVTTNIQVGSKVLRVEIHDEGPGISEEDMKKLFGKFARLSARPTGGEHSTGLGLSIVKKMVEAMNGRVWCESELGKGARFIVELSSVSA